MIRKNYNKLVRDNIIEIILKDGGKPVFKMLNNDDFVVALKEKLKEETQELYLSISRDDILSELSDVLELINYIAKENNITNEELENKRLSKKESRGGFDKKIFLEYSDEEK